MYRLKNSILFINKEENNLQIKNKFKIFFFCNCPISTRPDQENCHKKKIRKGTVRAISMHTYSVNGNYNSNESYKKHFSSLITFEMLEFSVYNRTTCPLVV